MNNNIQLTRKQLKAAAKECDKRHEKHKAYREVANIDFFIYIFVVIVAAFAIRLLVFEPVSVSGESMVNTLLDGERMFVEKISYCFTEPKRGDIVICYYPDTENPSLPAKNTCVKRIIGEPGDRLSIIHGITYINGVPLDETDWIAEPMLPDRYEQEIVVPDGCYFVMGDNRNWSKDSRNSHVGVIPSYRIVGRARSVIWPLDRYKAL